MTPRHRLTTFASLLAAGVLVAIAVSAVSSDDPADGLELGEISFPNSGSASAQEPFVEGVLLLHSFEYEDAARAFRRAQEADPDFALAYWGEAMTHNHPVWMQQDTEAGRRVLARLGDSVEARQAKAPTQREKDYLLAVETLFGTTPATAEATKEERDFAYAGQMRRMHESYPDDDEAAAFYSLAQLGTSHEGRDFGTYMRAAATAEKVWDHNRRHPGAAHYLIHSYDDPIHAPLGLPMARAYSTIAPAAAHAQHMTSHIFVALGLWTDVVAANEVARDVQNDRQQQLGQPATVCGHYPFWLEYGYLQLGRYEDAAEVVETCVERVDSGARPNELAYYSSMRARYLLDAGDWSVADQWPFEPKSGPGARDATFLDGFAAVRRGDATGAREALETLRGLEGESWSGGEDLIRPVLVRELEGLIALHEGDVSTGLEALRDAARLEEAQPFAFGPPEIIKPAFELLAEELLAQGRADEAAATFEEQLERTPLRTTSLLGLARAAEASDDRQRSIEAYSTLRSIWRDADTDVEGLEEVRTAGGTASSSR